MATTAAEIAMEISRNKPLAFSDITIDNGYRLVPSYLVDAVPVNESNIKMTVVAEGYQQENEIFK
jgi:ABC-type xylose transport system substrate-binding protein